MRILYCSGASEPPYCVNISLAYALRKLGHDVLWVGPKYDDFNAADISVEDRAHPEMYTYAEILALCPWKPDLILTVEPHFFFIGDKPADIVSAYYVLDPHRGVAMHHKALPRGNYNTIFNTQYHFNSLYHDLGADTCVVPQAFDERRFSGTAGDKPVCNISFVGQTGIAGMEYPYEDDIGRFATQPPKNLPTDHTRYAFHQSLTFDYAERAELLIRLCKDFSVRMYTGVYGENFERAIQTGQVGFHRSLLGDMTLRPFEIMAAQRTVVCDRVLDMDTYINGAEYGPNGPQHLNWPLWEYPTYGFKPFLDNFEYEYYGTALCIKDALYFLDRTDRREIEESKERIWKEHTWTARAKSMIDYVEEYNGAGLLDI